METCAPEQAQILAIGSAITEDFILVGYALRNGSRVFYDQTAGAGTAGGNGNGSGPQSYTPGSGASHASAVNLELAVLIAAFVAVVM